MSPVRISLVLVTALTITGVTVAAPRTAADGRRLFTDHKLYSLSPIKDTSKLLRLKNLESEIEIDFWNEPDRDTKINFRVAPEYQTRLERFLNGSKLLYSVITSDLQKWIDRERAENAEDEDDLSGRQSVKDFKFDYYHTNEEIYNWLDSLERRYPDSVRVIQIGKTYENHAIKAVKISAPVRGPNRINNKYSFDPSDLDRKRKDIMDIVEDLRGSETEKDQTEFVPKDSDPKQETYGFKNDSSKPAIWLDAGIHAREWVAPATAVYIINELATKHDSDPEVKKLVEKYDWYILPIANPDGYQYTWWTNRLWRKNRALPKATPFRYPWALFDDCIGTDPNRNFDIDFGGASTSSNPCSDIFRGDNPFSEKETQAIRDSVLTLGESLKAFISLHSYSQMWMIPYGYTSNKSPHHEELYELITKVVHSVQKKHNEWYRHGPISTTIYPAAGSSPDWAHEKAGIKYSFIAELRDRGDNGFILPRQFIIPTAEETWEGVKTIAQEMKV